MGGSIEGPCGFCGNEQAKYRCPKCLVQTCSLNCSKEHKVKNDCDGKRDKTAFIPFAEFNESSLMSDFRFIEEVGKSIDNASRENSNTFPANKLSQRQKILQKNANKRSMSLHFLPNMLSGHQTNQSSFDTKRKILSWTIKWIFTATETQFIDDRVDETTILKDIVEKKFGPKILRYTLVGLEGLKVLMKKPFTPANKPVYFELDLTSSIKDNLLGKTLIEYPTFHVILADESQNFETIICEKPDLSLDHTQNPPSEINSINQKRKNDQNEHPRKKQHNGNEEGIEKNDEIESDQNQSDLSENEIESENIKVNEDEEVESEENEELIQNVSNLVAQEIQVDLEIHGDIENEDQMEPKSKSQSEIQDEIQEVTPGELKTSIQNDEINTK